MEAKLSAYPLLLKLVSEPNMEFGGDIHKLLKVMTDCKAQSQCWSQGLEESDLPPQAALDLRGPHCGRLLSPAACWGGSWPRGQASCPALGPGKEEEGEGNPLAATVVKLGSSL